MCSNGGYFRSRLHVRFSATPISRNHPEVRAPASRMWIGSRFLRLACLLDGRLFSRLLRPVVAWQDLQVTHIQKVQNVGSAAATAKSSEAMYVENGEKHTAERTAKQAKYLEASELLASSTGLYLALRVAHGFCSQLAATGIGTLIGYLGVVSMWAFV